MIEEGCALVETALRRGRDGSYQIQAAIAAVHAEAETAERSDRQAIEECTNPVERAYLERRLAEVVGA